MKYVFGFSSVLQHDDRETIAVINGASVMAIGSTTVALLNSTGTPLNPVVSSAGVTVPKQQLNSTNDKITRVNDQWLRPATGGTYQLQFAGGGGKRTITFSVDPPDPSAKLPVKGASLGPNPGDFPLAQESLSLQGFLTTTINSGRPNQCGAAGGPSGELFAFGTYFQVDGTWYSLSFYSDPAVRQYSRPGTYTAIAALFGPTQRLYAGTVQLTVTVDQYPGADNGSVQGTLDRVGTTTAQPHQSVSGNLDLHARRPARPRLAHMTWNRVEGHKIRTWGPPAGGSAKPRRGRAAQFNRISGGYQLQLARSQFV